MFEDFLNEIDLDGIEDAEISAMEVDLDGDGIEDALAVDLDGDGVADSLTLDIDNDGIEDLLALDLDGNGELDSLLDLETSELVTELDQDGDGVNETIVVTQMIDDGVDGSAGGFLQTIIVDDDIDRKPDAITTIEGLDIDGSGTLDSLVISEDYNGDREINTITAYEISDDGELNEVGSWDMTALAESTTYTAFEGGEDGIIGDPSGAMEFWHPQEGGQCAVCAQEFVLEGFIGRDVDGDELREIAEENGWFSDGTAPEDVGKLLEHYGIEVERDFGNTYEDLRSALEDGNAVIVGVDSDELWFGSDEFFGPGAGADHAIQVIGIDERDPNNVKVIVNDSGIANGQGAAVPLDVFMNAWEDSNCYMMEAYADSIN